AARHVPLPNIRRTALLRARRYQERHGLPAPDQTRHNDAALERVINLPARGIGEKTVEALRQLARQEEISLWAALHQAVGTKVVSGRAASALNAFVELIDTLALKVEGMQLHNMAQLVIE